MASPTVDLDELQKEMLEFLPRLDLSALCCCSIIDTTLASDEHLDDCELRSVGARSSVVSSEANSTCDSPQEDDPRSEKRKRNRESMARLRQGWRASIAALQHQEEKLHSILRRMIAVPATGSTMDINGDEAANPLAALRSSYRELVQEQMRLEKQRASLEETLAHQDKYERLLQRGLVRIRLFHASTDNGQGNEDELEKVKSSSI
jgi:hypothetical protein